MSDIVSIRHVLPDVPSVCTASDIYCVELDILKNRSRQSASPPHHSQWLKFFTQYPLISANDTAGYLRERRATSDPTPSLLNVRYARLSSMEVILSKNYNV